jgi:hypothetical protein
MSGSQNWFNRFEQEWAARGLLDDPSNAQADAGFAFMGQAPPTVEQFNSLFNWNDRKDRWLYGQIANVILDSGQTLSSSDLMQLLEALRRQRRRRLLGPETMYIDSTNGSDANDGTLGAPWRTINRGIYYGQNDIDMAGQMLVLQLAPGQYDPVTAYYPMFGIIVISGNPNNPRGYLIKNYDGSAVDCAIQGRLWVDGVSVEAQGVDIISYENQGTGLVAHQGGVIHYSNIHFGPCSNSHMGSWTNGQCHPIQKYINYTIYGGARSHIMATSGGVSTNVDARVTIENNPYFETGFVHSSIAALVQIWDSSYTGTARGRRAHLDINSIILTNGAGQYMIPGDTESYIGPGSFIA